MERLSREDYFLERLHLLERRSSCTRGQVGALIIRKNRVIAEGYNGSPPGMPHCLDEGCEEDILEAFVPEGMGGRLGELRDVKVPGCTRAIHAESNAIAWAASFGIATHGAAMWCTYSPCRSCAQLILAAGITQFVYVKDYRLGRVDILDDAGVEVIFLASKRGDHHWDPGPDYEFTNSVIPPFPEDNR